MSRAVFLVLMLTVSFLPASSFAAEEAPEISVALLNVAKVFKQATLFTAQMAGLKSRIDAYELTKKLKEDRLKETAELVKRTSRENPDAARALEVDFKRDVAELQAEMEIVKRDFLKEEAAIYGKSYDAMRDEVAKICKARKIRLVLRANVGDPEDNADRTEVLQRVNRAVVFEDNLDITDDVIKALNAREKTTADPPQDAAR